MTQSSDPRGADCVFCRIVSRGYAAVEVYRDDRVTAFLAHHPVTPGHLLVIPNAHLTSLAEIPEELGRHLFAVGQRLAAALRLSGLPCEGINLFMADGEAAFQEMSHAHLHVFPRTTGDGFTIDSPAWRQPRPDRDDLDANARLIQLALARVADSES